MTARAPRRFWAHGLNMAIVAVLAGLILGTGTLALWFVESQSQRIITDQYVSSLEDQLDLLSEIRREEGRDGLLRAVARRARAETHGYIAARDADGALIAGNLPAQPIGADAGPRRPEVYAATRTIGDVEVLIGHDNLEILAMQRRILDAVWIGIAVVVAVSAIIAGAVTTYVLRRVDALSATAARVTAGDFSTRAPLQTGVGPFAEIARALNVMLDRIEDLITGLQTVTDSLAHDLRIPLDQARREIEAGLASVEPADKQRSLESASAQIAHTLGAFTSLIDIARAEGGLSREAMEDIALGDLAQSIVELFEPAAEDRAIHIAANLEDIRVSGHKPLLMQAMSNLLHNAIKFSPPGSAVSVTLGREGRMVVFAVADCGEGIPADMRGDAVRRFSRVGAESAPEGLGLGLAIARACAHLHRGRLELDDNRPGLLARLVLQSTLPA